MGILLIVRLDAMNILNGLCLIRRNVIGVRLKTKCQMNHVSPLMAVLVARFGLGGRLRNNLEWYIPKKNL